MRSRETRYFVVLFVVLMIIHQVFAFEPCVIHDNITANGTARILDYINKYGVSRVKPDIIFDQGDPTNMAWITMKICTDEYLELYPQTNVTYVISQKETLMSLNITFEDDTVNAWLDFMRSYNPDFGVCGNPPTLTLALGCQFINASQYFTNSIRKVMYPHYNYVNWSDPSTYDPRDPNYKNHTSWLQNSTIGDLFGYQTPEHLNFSWTQIASAFQYHIPVMFGYTSSGVDRVMESLSGGALATTPKVFHEFRTRSEPTTHDFFNAADKLWTHAWYQYEWMKKKLKREDIKKIITKYMDNVGNDLDQTSNNVDTILHHYKTMNWDFQKNDTTLRSFHDYMSRYNDNSFVKTKAYIIKSYPNHVIRDWANMADPSPIIRVYHPVDMINFIASVATWTAAGKLNTTFNESGCLGQGIPIIPVISPICKAPTFVGWDYVNIWPAGFDPYDPQCFDYQNYLTWLKMSMYAIFTPLLGWFFRRRGAYIAYFGWLVYNVSTDQLLPPNTYPCLIITWTPPIVFIVIFGFAMSCCGVAARATENVERQVLGDDEEKVPKMRDLTKLIPDSDEVVEKLTKPLEKIVNADLAGAVQGLGDSISQTTEGLRQRGLGKTISGAASGLLKSGTKLLKVIPHR